MSVPFDAEVKNYSAGYTLTGWLVGVVDPPEYARYRIVRVGGPGDEAVVYEFRRSENAPVVSLVAPSQGESVEGQHVELSWTISDADGDTLSEALLYSTDGGDTYQWARHSEPGSWGPDRYGEALSFSLDRARLEGSERARVMVVVSDGARWAAAESPVFSSAAPYVAEPAAREVPVRFVASASGGDGEDATALAGVTVAIVERNDRGEWWSALGAYSSEERTGIYHSIPPGAQVASTAEQIAAAPAQFVTTSADGTAHAELDRSTFYLLCAVSPDAPDVVAGCTGDDDTLKLSLGRPVTLHVYFSHGRAYLSDQAPAGAGRGAAGEASVTVVATSPALPYANALGELVWSHLDPGQDIAIIADADIGRWWDTVSGGDPAALDNGRRVRVAAPLVEASPARVITTNHRGTATASLPTGNYLLCAVHPIGRPDDRQLACTYRHIADTHDNILDAWCCDAESGHGGIEALDTAQGRALLQQAQHLKAR